MAATLGPESGDVDPAGSDRDLLEVLTRAQAVKFLGSGSVQDHVRHARALIAAIPQNARRFVDLGTGGGIPGLVVALDRPMMTGVLLDGSTRRGTFLSEAVDDLGISARIDVWIERAEDVGRSPERRGTADVVLSRSFGAPAVAAECAAPLLCKGGLLIVSDPPSQIGAPDRWPDAGLSTLGLGVVRHHVGPPAYTVLEQRGACPSRFPRRVGIPTKRPLF